MRMSYSSMSHQIFKADPPIEILVELLDRICTIEKDTQYMITIDAYKRMKYYNYHNEFLGSLSSYYHWSKLFYLERELTYSSFMTIIKQFCRLYNIDVIQPSKELYYIISLVKENAI